MSLEIMFYHQMKKRAGKGDASKNEDHWSRQHLTEVLQDLLTYSLVGLSQVARAGQEKGIPTSAGVFTAKAATATSSEWSTDPYQFIELIQQTVVIRDRFREQIYAVERDVKIPKGPADFEPATTITGLLSQADQILPHAVSAQDQDTDFLKHLLLSGIRGLAVYTAHAHLLGVKDESVFTSLQNGLAAIHHNHRDPDFWTAQVKACGHAAGTVMVLLDKVCSRHFGRPLTTRVPLGAQKGKAILVAGHNFYDLEALLSQVKGRNIRIYTYGEMIEAHQYPKFSRFKALAGHYEPGQDGPMKDFSRFPGAVLLTGGSPAPGVSGKISNLFTSGPLARPGISHIMNQNFSRVIDQALAMEGFLHDDDQGKVKVGNDWKQFASQADLISKEIRKKEIPRIFLLADCPHPASQRTGLEIWRSRIPQGARVIAFTCRDRELGSNLFSNPPWIKMTGQCRDPRLVVRAVRTLSDSLGMPASSLPVSLLLSWPGQKSMGVVMALISLGVKEIYLGPALPEGIPPGIWDTLQDYFGIRSASDGRGCVH